MTHSQACKDSNRFGDGFECVGEPRCQYEKKPLPTFEQAWAGKMLEGYDYGPDALESVRLGWELAIQHGVPVAPPAADTMSDPLVRTAKLAAGMEGLLDEAYGEAPPPKSLEEELSKIIVMWEDPKNVRANDYMSMCRTRDLLRAVRRERGR